MPSRRRAGFPHLLRHALLAVVALCPATIALGHTSPPARDAADALVYTPETVAAVERFRASERRSNPALGSPPGLVDAETVARLWAALERVGQARRMREQLLDVAAVRRYARLSPICPAGRKCRRTRIALYRSALAIRATDPAKIQSSSHQGPVRGALDCSGAIRVAVDADR
jgi:hypothetical protein